MPDLIPNRRTTFRQPPNDTRIRGTRRAGWAFPDRHCWAILGVLPGQQASGAPQMIARKLTFAAAVLSFFFAGSGRAAEITLLSALVMKPALAELSGDFERTT